MLFDSTSPDVVVATIHGADCMPLAWSEPFRRLDDENSEPSTLTAMRVMAAAPELLAACETALHELRIRCGYKGDEAAYVEVSAAIAKAAGRAE